ncbi:MAG: methionine adenosyltransferase [Archaeoglobi archaeon]|jgi:S-adenosylmethionine synthetase|nr:MAG: methionine adenosyltransferase [Archaeoglobi archaeon]TDA26375.1 MAG: methionine adenosyltransferase [Archaeoglobi archaeon]
MVNILIEELVHTPIEQQKVELVERKGIGHPDSLADGIAESMSRELCKEYIKRFGVVLHHNTDETQIIAGKSSPRFGGGEVVEPIKIILVGRATKRVENESIPTDKIALRAAKRYISTAMRYLDPELDVIFDVKLGEGSADLQDVFRRRKEVPLANDTSFGIGFAPLSETERLVYNVERRIYEELRKKEKAIGEDVKVMGLREKDEITLTIAIAMVDRFLNNISDYDAVKKEVESFVKEISVEYTRKKVEVNVNTADDYERGCIYLTVTGTSAENGDDGSVGRGNRCNGLITPGRPMSMEATSGKNPINHVGKLYNILANMIAKRCYEEVEGIEEIYVRILSQIGRPINDPKSLSIQVIPKKGYSVEKMENKLRDIAEEMIGRITDLTSKIVSGEIRTF